MVQRKTMKLTLTLFAAAAVVVACVPNSEAQSYYVAGDYQTPAWDPGANPMSDNGDGSYVLSIYGHTPGAAHEWKITPGSWSSSWPGSNVRSLYDTNGNFTFRWFPGVRNDGWNPQSDRVGYEDPGHGWDVMGSFNGWTTPVVTLTNQGAGLYEGAYVVPTAGSYDFKFRKAGDWNVAIGPGFGKDGNLSVTTTNDNQLVTFRLDLPHGRWLAGDPAPAPTNHVFFSVNMEVPIAIFNVSPSDPSSFDPSSDEVHVKGTFNGWTVTPSNQLFRVGTSSVFTNTFDIVGYQGSKAQYKYWATFPGDESPAFICGNARELTLTNMDMAAPADYWADRTLNDPTNQITLSVDMSVQTALGRFTPGYDHVYARGQFNNYDLSLELTNNQAANTNIYSGVVNLWWPLGGCQKFKFWNSSATAPNSGWESPLSTGGNDRQFTVTSPTQTLAVLFYNDVEPCDIIDQTNFVTFSIDMKGAVATDATTYDGSQTIYLNGDFLGWWGWGNTNGVATNYLMSRVSNSDTYTLTLPVPAGNNLRLQYKYSMNGADNEAAPTKDHVRYIRTLPGQNSYTLPLDSWTGTDPVRIANLAEPMFGYLRISPQAPGKIIIDWLGLKCVGLQSTTNLATWLDYPASAGTSSTNWPLSGDQMFFRLVKPMATP